MKMQHPNKIVEHFLTSITPPIIQFSPPRTGSTLLWNTLRVCLPNRQVLKKHKISNFQKSKYYRFPIICSIRNPLDAISSSIQANGEEPSIDIANKYITLYESYGMFDVIDLKRRNNVKILRYEDFSHDFQYLFSEIEIFFGQAISEDSKSLVTQEYSIESVQKISRELDSFKQYDKVNYVHGNHISKYKGAIGYYQDFLCEDQIKIIYNRLKDVFQAFDYENPCDIL